MLQRVDVSGDERAIELVSELRRSFQADRNVNTSARKPRADAFFDRGLECGELLSGTKVNVEETIVDGLEVNGDGEVVTRDCTLAISGH